MPPSRVCLRGTLRSSFRAALPSTNLDAFFPARQWLRARTACSADRACRLSDQFVYLGQPDCQRKAQQQKRRAEPNGPGWQPGCGLQNVRGLQHDKSGRSGGHCHASHLSAAKLLGERLDLSPELLHGAWPTPCHVREGT